MIPEGPPGGSHLCKTPINALFGVLYVGKSMYFVRMSEEARFPYMDNTRASDI